MKYYHALYMSKNIAREKKNIFAKLENNQWQFEKYLIVLTRNGSNQLEIFNAVLLIQKTFSKKDLFVVGIAEGYEEALDLVEKITQEVYDETGDVDIRGYILQKQKEFEEGNV